MYKHWRGTFYPAGLRTADEFDYYSLFFRTVELNNPFYRLPSQETFATWRKNSRDDFMYVVKANRFITHMKKLQDVKEALDAFLHNCDGLEEKLGPILFQLPPGWQLNLERFRTFLAQLPKGYRFAFEFRNPTWYTPEVNKLLEKYNCAFCIYQLAGHMSPIEVTANWVYLRLHGPTKNKYQGSYDFDTLRAWADKSREWQQAGKDVYIYFDNDDSGYAAFNAQLIEMMLNKDEPVTEAEAKLLAFAIDAIRYRKVLRFRYKGEWVLLEPYLVGLTRKGKGDLFVSGFARGEKNKQMEKYLFTQVEPRKYKLLDESFDMLQVNESRVYTQSPGIRVVYRTTVKAPKKTAAPKKTKA